MPPSNQVDEIRSLLAKGETKKAIGQLLSWLKDGEHQNEVILQSAALSRIEKDFSRQLIDWEKAHHHRLKIVQAVLDIIDLINQEDRDGIFSTFPENPSGLSDKLKELDSLLPPKAPKPQFNWNPLLMMGANFLLSNADTVRDFFVPNLIAGTWLVLDVKDLQLNKMDLSRSTAGSLSSLIQFIKFMNTIDQQGNELVFFDFKDSRKGYIWTDPQGAFSRVPNRPDIAFQYSTQKKRVFFTFQWDIYDIRNLAFNIVINNGEVTKLILAASGIHFQLLKCN